MQPYELFPVRMQVGAKGGIVASMFKIYGPKHCCQFSNDWDSEILILSSVGRLKYLDESNKKRQVTLASLKKQFVCDRHDQYELLKLNRLQGEFSTTRKIDTIANCYGAGVRR
jgi:hypothetical protein